MYFLHSHCDYAYDHVRSQNAVQLNTDEDIDKLFVQLDQIVLTFMRSAMRQKLDPDFSES